MIRSMTGYGSAEGDVGSRKLSVEIKAVNHRYFNFFTKLPQNLQPFEARIQALAKGQLSRGQISVFANWDRKNGNGARFEINLEAARAAADSLHRMRDELGLTGEVEVAHLLTFPALFAPPEQTLEGDALWEAVTPLVQQVLADLDEFRVREGADLESDLRARLAVFTQHIDQAEARRPDIVAEQKARLEKRLDDLLVEGISDERVAERVAVEIAVFTDRCDVSEEIVRLRSHVDKFIELLDEGGTLGRKLDFLCQEMNRETNTIGSKTPDAEASRLVIEMKAELEKIREQVQNIE